MLTRYKLYVGSNRYKLKSPSFSGKGSFVLGVALTVTENVSAHKDVTCFDGADGSITVAASGGTAPYVYSLDQNFTTTNSTGVFSGLSVSGTVYESTDQYGGIVVCHKTIYAKDVNGRIGRVDVELKSPVELDWVLPDNIVHYATAEEISSGYATVILPFTPYPTTTSNNYEEIATPAIPLDNRYQLSTTSDTTTYNMRYISSNDCGDADKSFTITIYKFTFAENTSAHHDVTCFDGGDGSITVQASGGVAPYKYSLDQTFATHNTDGVFSNLSITGSVTEGTDEYGGILICTKTIYVRDANGHTASLDIQLKSPVELEWLNVPDDMTVYCDAGQNYATVDLSMIRPSTSANNYVYDISGKAIDDHYPVGSHTVTFTAENDCGELIEDVLHITVLPN
jgi:hypothetical protein